MGFGVADRVRQCGPWLGLWALGCSIQFGDNAAGAPDAALPTASSVPTASAPVLDASTGDAQTPPADAAPTTPADAADGEGGMPPLMDAALDGGSPNPPGANFVGLVASPAAAGDAAPTNGDLQAELEVLALGSRAKWFEVRPDQVLGLSLLQERKDLYQDTGVSLLVNLSLRELLGASFSLPSEQETARYRALIDAVLAAPVTPAIITFGSALDVAFANLPPTDALDLADWLLALMEYARTARGVTPVRVGLSAAPAAWLNPTPDFLRAAAGSEVAGVAWLAVSEDGSALAPVAALELYQQLLTAVTGMGQLLAFQDVAYPTDTEVGGSEAAQTEFYTQLLAQLKRTPQQVPFVSIAALNELPQTTCATLTAAFDLPTLAETSWCSVGVRRRDGSKKPAYDIIAQGFAEFSAL